MKIFSIIITIVILSGCSSSSEEPAAPNTYAKVVQAIYQLHDNANANWPEHFLRENPQRNGTEFDVAQYFDVLCHLSPPEDFVLDYSYWHELDGRPFLYLRKITDSPFKTFQEHRQSFPHIFNQSLWNTDIASRLHADGTPESFFELAVFCELAGQFYLSWHCCYNDRRIVTCLEDVNQIIQNLKKEDFGAAITRKQIKQARQLDTAVRIQFVDDDSAEVSLVTFTRWGGFFRATHLISRHYPHTFIKTERQNLVEYNCGVQF